MFFATVCRLRCNRNEANFRLLTSVIMSLKSDLGPTRELFQRDFDQDSEK